MQEAAFGQPDEARLVDRLRQECRPAVSRVALRGEQIVGHVFVSPVTIEGDGPAAPACGGLAPLAVLPAEQGRGVGSALVRAALAGAREIGWPAVFLLGDPAYYGRFGFGLAAPDGFHYESAAFDAHFQWIALAPGALAGSAGFVRYAPAFAGL